MRNKTTFKKKGEVKRRESVSKANRKRWALYREDDIVRIERERSRFDHSYCRSEESATTPDLDNVVYMEETEGDVSDNELADLSVPPNSNAPVGRRIIDVDVLIRGLSECSSCCLQLSLANIVKHTQFGLSGFLHIQCQNPACLHVNRIPIGKRHGKIFDVNSKIATGNMLILEDLSN